MNTALYLRASTAKLITASCGEEFRQRPEIQEERLRQLCAQRGWSVVAVYCDRASGRKESRPELARMLADAHRGLFEVVAVAAFDRFARSLKHLVTALDEFRKLNIEFVSLREAIDTGTPTGRLLYQIVGAMAEFESTLISERTSAAMAYARAHGTRSGKAIGRARKVFRRDIAEELLLGGASYRKVARQLNVSVATLHRAIASGRPPRSERVATKAAPPDSTERISRNG